MTRIGPMVMAAHQYATVMEASPPDGQAGAEAPEPLVKGKEGQSIFLVLGSILAVHAVFERNVIQ